MSRIKKQPKPKSIFDMSRAEIIKAANSRIKSRHATCLSISSVLRAGGSDVKQTLRSSVRQAREDLTQKQRLVYDALLSGELKVVMDDGVFSVLAVCRQEV